MLALNCSGTRGMFFLTDLQPEFDDQSVVFDQLRLEIVDLGIPAHPVRFAAKTFHPFDQHAPVP